MMAGTANACTPGLEDPTCCPRGEVWNDILLKCEPDLTSAPMLGVTACAPDEFLDAGICKLNCTSFNNSLGFL